MVEKERHYKEYEESSSREEEAYSREKDIRESKRGDLSAADKQVLSRLFERAGKSFLESKEVTPYQISKAIGLYIKAEQYAPYENVKKRISKVVRGLDEIRKRRSGGLEQKVIVEGKLKNMAILSVSTLLLALFFVSSNLTGFAVLGINHDNLNILSSCIFLCGLIFTFIYLKNKDKKIKKKK